MPKVNVSFLADAEKINKLESLASVRELDLSSALNEALDQYLDLNDYHTRLIEQGIADIEAGRFVSHEEVKRQLEEQRAARKDRQAQ